MSPPVPETGDERPRFAAALRRVFAVYRLYGVGHEHANAAEQDAHQALGPAVDAGPLALEVSANGLSADDLVLVPDGDEQLTRVLYAEGIEAITLEPELPLASLTELTRAWYEAWTQRHIAEHSVATRLWETAPPGLALRTRPVLADDGVADAKRDAALDRLAAWQAHFTTEDRVAIDAGALAVVPELLDPGALDAHAERAQAELTPLSDVDRASLASDLGAHHRGAGPRALLGLWRRMAEATPDDRAAALELCRRMVQARMEAGQLKALLRAFTRLAERRATVDPDADRIAALLVEAEVFETLQQHLESRPRGTDAAALLALVPAARARPLAAALATANPARRARLLELLAAKRPPAVTLARWALHLDDGAYPHLLALASRLDEARPDGGRHRDDVLRIGLLHPDPAVRRRAAGAVRAEEVGHHRTLLLSATEDTDDPELARIVRHALVRAREPLAIERLAEVLAAPPDDPAEVRATIQALGTLGGSRARQVLLTALERDGAEIQRAAALALAAWSDAEVIAALRDLGGRRRVDREVRAACKEALRRIEGAEASP